MLVSSSCLPSPRVGPCLLNCRAPGSSTELRGLWKSGARGATSTEKLEEEDGEHLLAVCALLALRPVPLAMFLRPGEPQINVIWMFFGQIGPFPLRCVALFHAAGPPCLLLPPDPLFSWVFCASLSWCAWLQPCPGISPPQGKAGAQTLASSLARSRISPAMGLAAALWGWGLWG